MKTKLFLIVISSLFIIQCASQKNKLDMKMPVTTSKEVNSTYPKKNPEKGVTRLAETQNLFLEAQQVNITFKRVTEDSRCPMNARCIAAGSASAEIEVMSVHSRPAKFIISTENNPAKNLSNSFEFNGHKYTLVNFYPVNSTEVGFDELQGKYVVDIKVE